MSESTENKPLTPVLIIPGVMSSGLTCTTSTHKSWVGKRIWLNAAQMGFQSLSIGGALRANEQARASQQDASDALHQQYIQEMECKSRWLQHLCLQNDMKSEKDGIEVRPISGCAGVDYLSPGVLTGSYSYVFGPLLKLLKSKGYEEGINLDAAPYDWRLPPTILQQRDNYFTDTMEKVTRLYRQSNNTPVVILCHSMGCKAGHYLFNFVRHQLGEQEGQKWLDTYIQSYVPVGAPHNGAPKMVRSVIHGDKIPGLDVFLDNDEFLMMSRSLGSGPWCFPLENTSATPLTPSMPSSLLRLESSIILTIPTQTIPMKSFVYRRESMPSKVRLAIHLGEDFVVRTEFYPLSRDKKSPMLMLEEEVFCVALPPTIEQTLNEHPIIFVHLEELGAGKPRKKRRGVYHCDIFWPCRFVFCLMKWILCLPCAIVLKILRLLARGADRGIDLTAGAVGSSRAIGKSGKIKWAKGLLASSKVVSNDGGENGGMDSELRFQISPCDREGQGFFFEVPSPQECVLKVQWRPPSSLFEIKPFDRVTNKTTTICQYYPATTKELLVAEGLDNAVKLLRDSYDSDPIDPRGLSSWHPPPIQRVVAIYGINLPTEISGVYQRKQCVKLSGNSRNDLSVRRLIVMDKSARLNGLDGYTIEGGIIRETKVMSKGGTTIKKSGDGTVPYWSLQHCRTWQGEGDKKCDVKVYEIEGAEHRAILNDAKFHEILLREVLGVS